jgi:hypothetical protein
MVHFIHHGVPFVGLGLEALSYYKSHKTMREAIFREALDLISELKDRLQTQ